MAYQTGFWHGFYGAGSFEGTAESLLVTDPKEGWVFHVLPDPTGTSAVWAAQRVPAGNPYGHKVVPTDKVMETRHVSVVPNMFIIRDIDEKKVPFTSPHSGLRRGFE
ncbi:hypothetical protein T484DRAFT_1761358 [Baffinella frigidus]|nr:hypothetical protein T484DRAFT_1761358 [Cryptophyta sp. CCMP2293]